MPQINIDWFKLDFENFVGDKIIDYSPAFGICYRVRNSHYLSEEGSPITYELNSQEDSLHDFNFIKELNNKLRNVSESKMGNLPFKLGLTTVLLTLPNKSEDFQKDLATFLYIYMGMTKSFYEQSENKKITKSSMENLGTSTLLFGLKNGKKPSEVIFNYHLEESPNELSRDLKDKDLNKFIKSLSV